MGFEDLTPDVVIDAVEEALGKKMSGLASPLPSYINRVYELQSMAGERLIGKFYRPGRWSREALEDEHRFVLDCAAEEIPVIAPLPLSDGFTLGSAAGIHFAVFPKRFGRQLDIDSPDAWFRLGGVIGRIHMVGARQAANARVMLHPDLSTHADIMFLLDGGFVTLSYQSAFRELCQRVHEALLGRFDGIGHLRIHGDCHHGNILERPGEGLMIIDFDDMMTGPAIQDLWLLLPDTVANSRREIDSFLRGYGQFRGFDRRELRLIEPLRLMRLLYFLAWSARQENDFKFRHNFPDWGTDSFWMKEISSLRQQLAALREADSQDL